ncbi:cellulose binding domain-containing protein, partial [Amycolatopsis sp. SID8362]|uniref:cellulose binding domain-containing protein n=1 Tax=Amycolatopsis sp. SID8362 TaxID=2690346 RepID=UPI0014299129
TALVPDATPVVAAPGTSPPPPTSTTADLGCAASYEVTNSWPGGYQVQVTVRNDHDEDLSGWSVRWTLPGGHHITGLWNGDYTVDGPTVTVGNAAWNAKLDAGASTTFGFIALAQSNDAGRPAVTCRTL